MHYVLYLVVAVPLALIAGAARYLRSRRAIAPETPPALRSAVRVLSTEAEVHEAVQRAMAYDRSAADLIGDRARRYETVLSGGEPTRIVPMRHDPEEPARSA